MDFDGKTFDPALDGVRLSGQLERIRDIMVEAAPRWLTLQDLKFMTDYPETSISARLRDLRKDKFGGYIVNRRRKAGAGTWEYSLELPKPTGQSKFWPDGPTRRFE